MNYICNVCPECGLSLDNVDNVKHAISHWGVRPNELDRLDNQEARTRYETLIEVMEA